MASIVMLLGLSALSSAETSNLTPQDPTQLASDRYPLASISYKKASLGADPHSL